jgi:hypothetical protein
MASGDWLRLLQEALRNQLRRMGAVLAGAARLQAGQRLLAAARIRRIYAELMILTQDMGKPRPAAQTPLEYLPALAALFPTAQDDLAAITQAYLQVRYGELPETRQEVEVVEKAWARVRAQGLEQLNRKK